MDILPYIAASESTESFRDDYIQNMLEDLSRLLALPWKLFWDVVSTSEHFPVFLESYLRLCPRPYQSLLKVTSNPSDKPGLGSRKTSLKTSPGDDDRPGRTEKELQHAVFKICLRLCTAKEAQKKGVTEVQLGNTLYKRKILSVPSIMNFCAVFGQDNQALVAKMIASLCTLQPKLSSELEEAVPMIVDMFAQMETKAREWDSGRAPSIDIASQWLGNMMDFSWTLNALIKVYQQISSVLQFCDFVPRACAFYNHSYPAMYRFSAKENSADLALLWQRSSILFLNTLHTYSTVKYVQPLTSLRYAGDKTIAAEYCAFLDEMLGHRVCFIHFNRAHDVLSEMLTLSSTSPSPQLENLIQRVMDIGSAPISPTAQVGPAAQSEVQSHASNDTQAQSQQELQVLRSQVASVLDILPGMGEGFLAMALESCSSDVEQTINAFLTQDLPKAVTKADQQLSWDAYVASKQLITTPDKRSVSRSGTGKSKAAAAVDTQEYAVHYQRGFNQTLEDGTVVYKGKKNKTSDMTSYARPDASVAELTKQAVQDQHDRAEEARLAKLEAKEAGLDTVDMRGYKNAKFKAYDLYDDEYDDTFDSLAVGVADDTADAQRTQDNKNSLNQSNNDSSNGGSNNGGSGNGVIQSGLNTTQSGMKNNRRDNKKAGGKSGNSGSSDSAARGRGKQTGGAKDTNKETSGSQAPSRGRGKGRGGTTGASSGQLSNNSHSNTNTESGTFAGSYAKTGESGKGRGRGRGGSTNGPSGVKNDELSDRDKAHRDKNKSRFGNHNRKAGADRKMRTAMN